MTNNIKLSVIIPAYNEEKSLAKTLREVAAYLQKQNYRSEIVVISYGSKDKPADVVKELQREISGLRLIDNKDNHGKGYVVRQAMLAALGEYRLFTDADNSTALSHIERFWSKFEQGFDVVIGTRDSRDDKEAKQAVPQPAWKRMLGDIGNLVIQFLLLPGIWDTQCGFKAFSAKATQVVFPKMKIERWAFDVEILALAKQAGFKIALVPVYWINGPESRVNLKGYVQTFFEILKIKLNFIKGVYGKVR